MIKRLILTVGLLLVGTTIAQADCNGQFPTGYLCGNAKASQAPPTGTNPSTQLDASFGNPAPVGSVLVRGSTVWSSTITPVIGNPGSSTGTLGFASSAGGLTTIQPSSVAGSTLFQLPPDNGTNGYVLTTDGSGHLTWTTGGGAITGLTGDVTATGPGIAAATVNHAPAAGITGTTLSSTVVASSLTAFGNAPTIANPLITGLPTGAGAIININSTNCQLGQSCTVGAASLLIGVTTIVTGTTNGLLYDNGGILGNLATANSGVLVTSSAGAPSISTTLPTNLVMGTPASITLTNGTGLPLTTGVTGILPVANGGTNCSSGSITCFNNITGFTAAGTTGITSTNLVFSTSPTLVTPILGTPTSVTLTNATGLPLTTGVTGVLPLANGGTNNNLTASAGGVVWSDASKLNILAGTVTAGLCLLSGSSAAPTWGSCTGAAAVASVTNSDGSLTISPTTGAVVASLNVGNANTWAAIQTFTNSDLRLLGSSTGYTTFTSANAGASNFTLTFPAVTTTLAGLGLSQTFTATNTFSGAIVCSGSIQCGTWTVSGSDSYNNNAGNVGVGTSSPKLLFSVGNTFGATTTGDPWCDVRAEGAVGDGSTNDHAAIAACLTNIVSAGGGVVYFPPGHYCDFTGTTTSSLVNLALIGAGVQTTLWDSCAHDVTVVTFGGPMQRLEHMTILGDQLITGTHATVVVGTGCSSFWTCLINDALIEYGYQGVVNQSQLTINHSRIIFAYGDYVNTVGGLNIHDSQIDTPNPPGPCNGGFPGARTVTIASWATSTNYQGCQSVILVGSYCLIAGNNGTSASSGTGPVAASWGVPIADGSINWYTLGNCTSANGAGVHAIGSPAFGNVVIDGGTDISGSFLNGIKWDGGTGLRVSDVTIGLQLNAGIDLTAGQGVFVSHAQFYNGLAVTGTAIQTNSSFVGKLTSVGNTFTNWGYGQWWAAGNDLISSANIYNGDNIGINVTNNLNTVVMTGNMLDGNSSTDIQFNSGTTTNFSTITGNVCGHSIVNSPAGNAGVAVTGNGGC